MAPIEPTLFSWRDVESSSDIVRLRRTLDALGDAKLIEALVAQRKGRRDDYPIVALWHSLFAAFFFNLPGPAALIRELHRNAELRQVCGFDSVLGEKAVPPDYVYSRFLKKLVQHHRYRGNDQRDEWTGGHLIIADTQSGRWADLKSQPDGVFIRAEPAWRPGTNQLLCRMDDGLAVLELALPEESPSSKRPD